MFLGLRSASARGGRLLAALTGGRIRVARFGDGWTMTAPTGTMRTSRSFEEVVGWCGPFLREDAVTELAGEGHDLSDDVAVLVAEIATRTLSDEGRVQVRRQG